MKIMSLLYPVALASMAASGASAESRSITVVAEDGFHFIRCIDMYGDAQCEYLVDDHTVDLSCVAFDANGAPVATSVSMAFLGNVVFFDVDASIIGSVICRR